MKTLEEIQHALKAGMTIEEIAEKLSWKEFESLCSEILEEHDFEVKKNYRFKLKSWFEIDILATKPFRNYTIGLVIDCKHWGIRKGKKSALKRAALKQEERAKQLKKANTILLGRLETFPLIVTLMEEDIKRVENIWIVPIFKLNSFLLNLEEYLDLV
jgi:DNA-binding transcriptional MerR regulator